MDHIYIELHCLLVMHSLPVSNTPQNPKWIWGLVHVWYDIKIEALSIYQIIPSLLRSLMFLFSTFFCTLVLILSAHWTGTANSKERQGSNVFANSHMVYLHSCISFAFRVH